MFGSISTTVIAALAAPAIGSLPTAQSSVLSFEMTMLDDVAVFRELTVSASSIPTVESAAPRCEIVDASDVPTMEIRPASTTERVDSCSLGSFIRFSAPNLVVSSR